MAHTVTAPRARKSFSRLKHVLDLPNLIDIQRESFDWFLREGLRETIDDISPIEDYTGSLAVEFGDYRFGEPQFSIQECREKDLTFQAPLSMTVRFVNKDTGEIREQTVFMGDFPMMTEWGTFIINGTERVIVTQLVRSPGAYLMEPKDATKQVFTANLMPQRGSWLELEIDKKGQVFARIDRKRKLPVTTLFYALESQWTEKLRAERAAAVAAYEAAAAADAPPRLPVVLPNTQCAAASAAASASSSTVSMPTRRSKPASACSRRGDSSSAACGLCKFIPAATARGTRTRS